MKNWGVHIRFLLGPAGSGKTYRCLAEIRAELARSPEGLPLVFIAPKQATFQLERQLLDFNGRGERPHEPLAPARAGSRGRSLHQPESPTGPAGALQGYTRLHILSFERLAEFVFDQLGLPLPELLAEEGRMMVLQALLGQHRSELRLFRASARLPGFARQLSQLLREFQRYHLTPARLESLAHAIGGATHLEAKLRDLALILRAYADWLKDHHLEDADGLLDLAEAALLQSSKSPVSGVGRAGAARVESRASSAEDFSPRTSPFALGGLWLDGFAQMTPQERRLLAAVAQCAENVTLAFCLDGEPQSNRPWHSHWSAADEAVLRCRDEFSALPGADISMEVLGRKPEHSRFRDEPWLRHLEANWGKPGELAMDDLRFSSKAPSNGVPHRASSIEHPASSIRLVACANPEAETEWVAREIRRYVRQEHGRFRDVAVLLRSLELYHDPVRRVFTRYEIPFFLDRRESVAHHPLAELTRYALRVVAYGWEHEDWFGALKTGLVQDDDASIDRLENEALARGWSGPAIWLEPLRISGAPDIGGWLERLRRKIVPPFQALAESVIAVQQRPTGAQLGAALREFWKAVQADRKLERWSSAASEIAEQSQISNIKSQIHEAVWEQMAAWVQNLELAFSAEALPLIDWLPILEAGLGNLTVGVIPPALDQVLVGAIDRSRNPDLQIAFVLGANEGIFPAPPPAPALLNRADREALASHDVPVGPDLHQEIGLERYYGYIACTRARRRLVLTYARRDAEGRELNASPFIGELRRLFVALEIEEVSSPPDWQQAEHWSELIIPCLRDGFGPAQPSLIAAVPRLEPVATRWRQMADSGKDERLPSDLVEKVYGAELLTSVSGLEDFAACPFKFLAGRGLRAQERLEFEIDPRERGSFQHEVLKEFHLRLRKEGKRWRDISPAAARALLREVGEERLPRFRGGLFLASQAGRFAGEMLIQALERLIESLVAWAGQYQFDPAAVETSFGLKESRQPAWRIDLDGNRGLLLRGRIDRVDLCRLTETGETLGVVIDYKSSPRQLDRVLLQHGLELQLLAYLGALAHFREPIDEGLDVVRIIPAGAFYVALQGGPGAASTREQERDERGEAGRAVYQHRGRFDGGHLEKFDPLGQPKGDQFRYARNKDGSFASRGNEALATEDFRALIAQVEHFLRQHGREIYDGKVSVAPHRWKNETACDFCPYRPVCRFDPWTQPYRVLRAPEKEPR